VKASYIEGICSHGPGLAESLSERVIAGIPVELVISADAANVLGQEPYHAAIKNLLNFPNFKIWVTRIPLKVGLTVTDKCISLGLYKKDGKLYDSSSDLFSLDPVAITCGEDLFSYFKGQSDPFKI
jgi:predicted transcriptional regulator